MANSNSTTTNKETLLLLIDNDCKDLNIDNISSIIKNNFDQVKHVLVNNELVDKDVFENYLPIATSSKHLNLDNLTWDSVSSYSDLVFLTDKDEPLKDIKILALYYRIITGKSIILIKDGIWSSIHLNPIINYYPFFLTIFSAEDCKKCELPEVENIPLDQMISYKNEIIEQLKSLASLNDSSKKDTNMHDSIIDFESYEKCFLYILNGGKDFADFFKNQKFDNTGEKDAIDYLLSRFSAKFENTEEFKFYNAQFVLYKSLANKLQVSIPTESDTQIFVYKTNAADFNFRNLKFKNVLINNHRSDKHSFVLPFYKDEQATRQTVRFLIMFTYNVYNNSALVDMIVLYLFIKVSGLSDKLVKTKYENTARLFLKRHGEETEKYLEFLKSNRTSILALKKHFKELQQFQDEEDLYALFDDFVSSDFKHVQNDFIKPFEVVYYEESDLASLNENILESLPEADKPKDQEKPIEINDKNWPVSENYKCDESKLQLNASLPFYICVQTYQDFIERINQIKWIKSVVKYTDKLVLKGGAILDILSDRVPKDYDLMNIGMSNDEFIDFLCKFVKETNPKSIEFIPSPVSLFRIEMENGDLVELILNTDISGDKLFSSSYLPDQVCFLLSENKLVANEYTLWALKYGYCELTLETHPRANRLSKKLNKLGFNFYYNDQFKNNTKFLKERLERYIWSICQSKSTKIPSYQIEDTESKSSDKMIITKTQKNKLFADKKQIFANKKAFLDFIQNEINKNDSDLSDLKILDFNGAIILPERKLSSLISAKPLDWSF